MQNEVSRDVGRPAAHVVADVRNPVAAVREGPEGCGFGGEGGGGELLEIPIGMEHHLFSKIRVYFKTGRVGKKYFGFVGTIRTAKERRFFVNPKWNL